MYCSNCGNKIVEGNSFCTKCGVKIVGGRNNTVKKEKNGLKTASLVLGILGIVISLTLVLSPLAFVISLVGIILGVIAKKSIKNVEGILISSIGLFLSSLMFVISMLVIYFVIEPDNFDIENEENSYKEEFYDYGKYGHYEKF